MKHSRPYPLEVPSPPHPSRVALTGGTGFVGSAVLTALVSRGIPVASLARDPAVIGSRGSAGDPDSEHSDGAGSVSVVPGHLGSSAALTALCATARLLIHAASYVGPDLDRQQAVNVDGTRALVEAARRAGVDRIVYLSTAGVYGGVLGPGFSEDEAQVAPRSALSRSRRRAEEIVLDAGGIIVRPHLVHGAGDRWFLSQLLAAMGRLGAWIGGPDVALSTIGRERLGALITSVALHGTPGVVYHAAEKSPARVHDLIEPVYRRLAAPLPRQTMTPAEAYAQLAPLGVTRDQLELIGTDSWFQADRIWSVHVGARSLRPLPTVLLPEGADWYADYVRAHAR